MKRHNYTDEEFVNAVKESKSYSEVCKKLDIVPRGGNLNTIKRKIYKMGLDSSHFLGKGWNKNLTFVDVPKIYHKELTDLLTTNSHVSSHSLRNRLIKEGLKLQMCECCKNTKWNNKPIPLELHHINGIHTDNRLENLQILCPNCHQQTNNYGCKNIKKPEQNVMYIFHHTPSTKNDSICEICGKKYTKTHKNQKYCSIECFRKVNRKTNKITKETLIEAFLTYHSFLSVGKFFGVSNNSIVKWCKKLEMPYKRLELEQYINEYKKHNVNQLL